jgi:hypothetical protein
MHNPDAKEFGVGTGRKITRDNADYRGSAGGEALQDVEELWGIPLCY